MSLRIAGLLKMAVNVGNACLLIALLSFQTAGAQSTYPTVTEERLLHPDAGDWLMSIHIDNIDHYCQFDKGHRDRR